MTILQPLADMGVPMIGIYWLAAWLAFIPVVAIEAWWARRVLGGDWKRAVIGTFTANLVSTAVGIPLAWFVWSTLELWLFGTARGLGNPVASLYAVTVQAAWLIPYEKELWWMIPAAALVLTGGFFVGSVLIEGFVMRGFQRSPDARALRRWAWQGNLISYTLIFTFVVVLLYVPRRRLDRAAHRPVEAITEATYRAATWLHRHVGSQPRASKKHPGTHGSQGADATNTPG